VAKPHGYPKAARLRRRREYLTVQRDGRRRHTAHLVVIQRPAPGPLARFGVTASKRIGNAVVRNRLKRVLRAVFRAQRAVLVPAVDVVVIAKPGADRITYAQATDELLRALDLRRGR
jgi:ribonuclease P protein component